MQATRLNSYSIHSDAGVFAMEVPLLASRLQPNTTYDWNYTTVPQTGLDGRVISYTRGHVLGGSSSISEFCVALPRYTLIT